MITKIKYLLKKNKYIYIAFLRIYRIPNNLITGFLMIYYLPSFSLRKIQPKKIEKNLIVSFTSYSERIKFCAYVVESIFAQKIQPEKIILWISAEHYTDISELPRTLRKQLKRGLQINFVEKDLGPHTKYYYAMIDYPDKTLVTVDDDIIYPKNTLSDLVKKYKDTNKKFIISSLTRKIQIKDSFIGPYNSWEHNLESTNPSHHNLALGVYGVLYPPKSLFTGWHNQELLFRLSGKADDIWLKFMEILQNTRVISLNKSHKVFRSILFSQKINLRSQNVGNNRNDIYVKNIVSHYSSIDFTSIIDEKVKK